MTQTTIGKVQLYGYFPGAIGKVTELHATYYSKYWAFDVNFESQVATELSEFLLQFNKAHDGFWLAMLDKKIVGSIAVDGRNYEIEGARLRWFILAPEYQGQGIGQMLMQAAIDFCKIASFKRVYLWTFAGLTAARHLYEKWGFTLSQEHEDREWGNTITHQMFTLNL